MAELRISDLAPGPGGRRRVELTWRDGPVPRQAVTEFADEPGPGDGERIRWYLEDYAEFPADPAPEIARAAERRLAQVGVDLFTRVFSGSDAIGIWDRARDRLGEVRIEVDSDPSAGPGLAWELLRDPARDEPVALGAGAFVRTHWQAAGHPDLPEPAGDRLRVLLVICRPGGRDDVPFRSVASRLVRGGAAQMEGLDLDVLRPATFTRLSQALHAAYDAGRAARERVAGHVRRCRPPDQRDRVEQGTSLGSAGRPAEQPNVRPAQPGPQPRRQPSKSRLRPPRARRSRLPVTISGSFCAGRTDWRPLIPGPAG
jgi:hypothetical protein